MGPCMVDIDLLIYITITIFFLTLNKVNKQMKGTKTHKARNLAHSNK